MKKNKDTIVKLREKNKRLRSDLAKKKAVSKNLMGKGMHCNIPFFIRTLPPPPPLGGGTFPTLVFFFVPFLIVMPGGQNF